MSRTYYDLTALADAAKAHGCTVHLHHDEHGRDVYSVGNSNTGAREFDSYADAMSWINAAAEKAVHHE